MIEMVGVSTSDRRRPHLSGCSLRAAASEIHALVGPPSSGKTLLLDVLVGLQHPVRGVSQVLGFDSTFDSAAVRQRVTYVPRGGAADGTLSLAAQVMWVLKLAGRRPTSIDIRRALRMAEIPDRYFDCPLRQTPPECRILAWLAVASLRGNHVVILDDPSHTLSALAAKHLSRVLREWRTEGACLLLTSQDRQFAESVATVMTTIEDGRTSAPRVVDDPSRATAETSGLRLRP